MASPHGNYVWYELNVANASPEKDFYCAVVGWNVVPFPGGDGQYSIFNARQTGIAGVMDVPEGADHHKTWLGYVFVDNVDQSADKAKSLGGNVAWGPDDIPNVGRFAICTDPFGAVFGIFHTDMPAPERTDDSKLGHIGWHELYTGDVEKVFDFYAALFGWQKDQGMDMGPMGVYQTFSANGEVIGGIMKRPDNIARPMWLYYFLVDDINVGAERIAANGGKVCMGPMEVPGGGHIVQGEDPRGLPFALLAFA